MSENNINGGIPSVLPHINPEPQSEDQKRTTEMYSRQPQIPQNITDIICNDIRRGKYDESGTIDIENVTSRLNSSGIVDVQATIDALNMLDNVPLGVENLPLPEDVKLNLEGIATYGRLREFYEILFAGKREMYLMSDVPSKFEPAHTVENLREVYDDIPETTVRIEPDDIHKSK